MAILIVMALPWLYMRGETRVAPGGDESCQQREDSLTVSLITCYPGPEIYELYGHEAIRVRGNGIDSVWNFGVFDFNEPNFIYRFVKGETDYLCVGYPFEWFLPEYVRRGSKVVEQDLNMTGEEASRMLGVLRAQSLPENRRYRYNYVKDNCATRILDRIDDSYEARVIYPDTLAYGTFRNEMRAYNRHYPWYQFGIDICLGSGIDYPLGGREEMFVPVEMMRKAGGGRLSDGRQLVRETRVLAQGRGDVTLPPTPWYLSPPAVSWLVFLLAACLCIHDLKRRHVTRWAYSLWFVILGLAGTLTAFLVFISSHEATSPNVLIMWLNPLQLLFGVCLWWRATRPVATVMACINCVAMLCMSAVWPFQHQSANPAFFPLMGVTLMLSATYAIIIIKDSYNNNGVVRKKEDISVRRTSRGRRVKSNKRGATE